MAQWVENFPHKHAELSTAGRCVYLLQQEGGPDRTSPGSLWANELWAHSGKGQNLPQTKGKARAMPIES